MKRQRYKLKCPKCGSYSVEVRVYLNDNAEFICLCCPALLEIDMTNAENPELDWKEYPEKEKVKMLDDALLSEMLDDTLLSEMKYMPANQVRCKKCKYSCIYGKIRMCGLNKARYIVVDDGGTCCFVESIKENENE